MDVNNDNEKRCRQCKEVIHHDYGGFVYCAWWNMEVYAESLMCQHGKDLEEIF